VAALALKDKLSERALYRSRSAIMFLFVLALTTILMVRMFQLQVLEHEAYQTRSEQNRIQVQPLAPRRGLIFDRHGELLADNRAIYNLSLVKERVPDLKQTIDALAALVEVSEGDVEEFETRLKRRRRPFEAVMLRSMLSDEERAVLAVNRNRLPGVEITPQTVRYYPYGELFAHAIGSVRRINEDDLRRLDPVRYSASQFMGKRGVEAFYERSLHGEVGYQQVEVDAHGRIRNTIDTDPPAAGQNISVHLDSHLQIAASAALGLRRGAVVALDPRSGGVLALVSNPAYDPNLFVTGISAAEYGALTSARDTPLFNRAVNGQYAPGSTFKPVVGLAALSHGLVTWDEQIEDRGAFKLANQDRIYRDWSWQKNNSGGQGMVDLNRAIYRSSNVYFYHLGTRLHIDQLVGFASQFGFGQQLALDVADSSAGLLPDPVWKRGAKGEVWYPGDNVNMSIGQGDLLVTPLQLATYAATIANRGRIVRPRLLLSSDAPLVEHDPPPPRPPVAGPSPDDWERIVDAMEDVVHRGNKGFRQNGTAWAYIGQDITYRMAGKSGTAQVVEIRQGEEYDEEELDEYNRKHAWFIAFAPADKPMIALAVLVENGGGGSSVAAPVAREVVDAYLLPKLALTQVSAGGAQ
jgi:penicillin-binding protein 2